MFDNKIMLITGGTGSFGNAVLRRFLNTDIGEIRIFSRDEKKQHEMRTSLSNRKVKFYIGDVRNKQSVTEAMRGVDFVFHAAALKQVPSCEFYPMEAVRTNIMGSDNVMQAAQENCIKRVIVLSTDKAVYPINAMGMSKAIMEKLMVARSRLSYSGDTVFAATRYGNVMASRGSVIPLFARQIREGQHLTITDPNMTRFLMSLDDSVDLVLHAFQHAQQGDIFVQKAPAATIETLSRAIMKMLNREVTVRIIGTRHGEKLYETLVSREEMARVDDRGRFYRIPAESRDLNYQEYFVEGEPRIACLDDYTSHNATRLDIENTITLLSRLPSLDEAQHD